MNTLRRINSPNHMLLKSIKVLGLKVTDYSLYVESDQYHVSYDNTQTLARALDLYHLYVDGKLDYDTRIRKIVTKNDIYLSHDKTIAEKFRLIKAHLDSKQLKKGVKKKRVKKKRVSFNLENNVVHIIPNYVLHVSEKKISPDVVEGESSCSENEDVAKSESEIVNSESKSLNSESDVPSSSDNSFEGMVAYRKPILQDLQKYETQSWVQTEDYVQKPYDVQIPKCDLHFRNTSSYLKPRKSQKKKKKRKVKKFWMPKVKNVEKVQKIVTNSFDSRKSVTRWRNEKIYQGWYNVIIDNFCFPTKEPKISRSSVYSKDGLISQSKDKLDAESDRILIERNVIAITKDGISKIIGLSQDGVDMVTLPVCENDNPILVQWKSQYPGKKYRGKAYVESISRSNEEADLMFKLNFLTLFINTFIESYPMGTSNVKVVNKLVLLKDFSTIDWCGYILHSLRTTKAKWNRDNKLSNYTGPMLVLLLYYVYWTKYESISLRKGHPFIQFVNDKQLLEIETFELMRGGFGKKKLDSTENLGVDINVDEVLICMLKQAYAAIIEELFHEPHDDEVANETETESDNESNDNEIEDGDEDMGVSHHSPAAGAGHHSPVAFETPQPVREEELTFTQVLDQPGVAEEVYAMVDQTEETSLKKKQKKQEKEQEKEKEKEEVVAEPRPKRNVKSIKNDIEKVWENDLADMLYQSDVYTFKSNFYINWRIINCWISIMNARECLKSDESPARLFLHSDCMASDYMLDGSVLELIRMNQFNMLFTATCNNLDINPNLRSIILVIFPIINQGKYYMLCFDLKKPSYVLIDHIVRMGTTTNRYGPIPLTLHKFFCYYLKSQRHPSLKALSKMEANIQNLPWSVIKSGDNCGLYLMRHMECYMGEREGMWETGLTGKGMIDSAAFLGLWYKYMAAIFTLVINKFKEMIDKELTEFKKLDENGRAKLLAEAETRNLKNKRKRDGRIG
ncbi:hypothetical protein LXL04_001404 [Taraxacum kok-saghyz]